MRILHIVGTVSPQAGGPTEVIRMLVRYAPAGYASELATLDDPAAEFLSDFPFPVHAFGSARRRWFRPRLITWLRENRHRFDRVIVHGLWEFSGLAAMIAVSGRVPYVVFTHGALDPYFKRDSRVKRLKKWVYWLAAQYWVLRRADRVLFTTRAEEELAQRSFWPRRWRAAVVPLGSAPPPGDTPALVEAFERACPGVAGRRFLLFLGRIHQKKGCDLLVRAFAEHCSEHAELHLVMAGPDPVGWREPLQRVAAERGCEDRVHWPGMLSGAAKWGAFAACDAFILPSHQENFGIAVAEALASGRPVLLTHPVNIAEELSADGCALVEPDTQEGVSRLLARWVALTFGERETMAARARESFMRRYDMRRNAEAVLRVFEQTATSGVARSAPPLPEAR